MGRWTKQHKSVHEDLPSGTQFIVESPPEAPLLEKEDSYEINDGVAEPVSHDMTWKCGALGRNTK